MSVRRIAAFDFDGTLTRRDTLAPFLIYACGRRAFARAASRAMTAGARTRLGAGAADTHHRDAAKSVLLADLLGGRDRAWLSDSGANYARRLSNQVRPEMAAQVAWHRSEGHELVMVSASLCAYLDPFGREHQFDHVIAVSMQSDPSGRLTGLLDGPNVRGPEKAVRFGEWLGGDSAEIWAYGNSSGDAELLALASHPVWIGSRKPSVTTRVPSR